MASGADRKHFKCKNVNDVAVITIDSPGVKVIMYNVMYINVYII